MLTLIEILLELVSNNDPFLGNETTRSGVNRFWHLMQHEELNRRLIWILIEVRDPQTL